MYTFDDGGGRSLTLRPEGTAPVCRAYIEHGMHKLPQPVKLWYLSSFFRAEAPQRGRYRQFWQVGAEAIGAAGPETDAELILLLAELLEARRGQGDRACGCRAWAPPATRARVPRGADRLPARARGRPLARGRAPGSTSTRCAPSTPIDPRTRETMRDAPNAARPARTRGRRALRSGPRAARRRRPALRARPDARARPRLLHAHAVRVHERRARRAVRRRRRRPLRPADRAARRTAHARRRLGGRRRADAARRRRAAGRAPSSSTCSSCR